MPAAAIQADALARHCDFFSIGTNDLTQYALAIDRQNTELAPEADSLHPAVLRLVQFTVEAALRHRIDVSVCGEMAGDTKLTRLLLGMGLREFSMHPAQLLSVKQEILNSDLAAITTRTRRILRAIEPGEIAAAVEQLQSL